MESKSERLWAFIRSALSSSVKNDAIAKRLLDEDFPDSNIADDLSAPPPSNED